MVQDRVVGARQGKKRETRAQRLPDNLPVREEKIITLAVQAEPEAWRQMGEEVTDQLEKARLSVRAAHALLAALKVSDVLPIALLSRELRHLHDDAAALLRGRHVHILPHNDADTDEREFHHGQTAAEQWASTLFYDAGAERVTFATLECLTRPDGQPAKDLCDGIEDGGVDRNRAHLRHLLSFDY